MGTFDRARRARGACRGRVRSGAIEGIGGPLRPLFDHDHSRADKPDYKTAALCKQVRRIVGMALSGECADPVLQELLVEEVLPAPHAGRLLVRVMLRAREGGPTVLDVLQRLARVEGMLRASVGEGIVRKRIPELAFDVIPVGPIPPPADEPEVYDD